MTAISPRLLRLACAGVLLTVTACGSSGGGDSASSSPKPSATVQDPQSAQSSNVPTTKPSRPPNPLAPATRKPVKRNGKSPRPSITAKPAAFSEKAAYSDGVSLSITKLRPRTLTDQGPGGLQGPATSIELRFVNGSDTSVDLNTSVVSLDYGSPARVAPPVYTPDSQDFSGTVKPGATAEATYTYLISAKQARRARLTVDFDGSHVAAVFQRGMS